MQVRNNLSVRNFKVQSLKSQFADYILRIIFLYHNENTQTTVYGIHKDYVVTHKHTVTITCTTYVHV